MLGSITSFSIRRQSSSFYDAAWGVLMWKPSKHHINITVQTSLLQSTEINHRFLEAFPLFLSEEPSPFCGNSNEDLFPDSSALSFRPHLLAHRRSFQVMWNKKQVNGSILIFNSVFSALPWPRPISHLKLKFRKRAASPRKWVTLPEQNIHDIPSDCEPSVSLSAECFWYMYIANNFYINWQLTPLWMGCDVRN